MTRKESAKRIEGCERRLLQLNSQQKGLIVRSQHTALSHEEAKRREVQRLERVCRSRIGAIVTNAENAVNEENVGFDAAVPECKRVR
jgi:hypothetical protein